MYQQFFVMSLSKKHNENIICKEIRHEINPIMFLVVVTHVTQILRVIE